MTPKIIIPFIMKTNIGFIGPFSFCSLNCLGLPTLMYIWLFICYNVLERYFGYVFINLFYKFVVDV